MFAVKSKKIKANKQVTSPQSELNQGETQREKAGHLISFGPLLLGVVSFFFTTQNYLLMILAGVVQVWFVGSVASSKAYPRHRWVYLIDMDSPPLEEVLSLGLTAPVIVPSIAPSESQGRGGGMDVVAPISAAVWAPRGQRASISGRGEASVSSGLTDPASMAPSPSFEIWGLLHGGSC